MAKKLIVNKLLDEMNKAKLNISPKQDESSNLKRKNSFEDDEEPKPSRQKRPLFLRETTPFPRDICYDRLANDSNRWKHDSSRRDHYPNN
jgi:hypothetical protein